MKFNAMTLTNVVFTYTSFVPSSGVFMADAEEMALNTDVNAEIL